jgi:hypothetical protein
VFASAQSTHDAVIVNGILTALSVVVTAGLALVAVWALQRGNGSHGDRQNHRIDVPQPRQSQRHTRLLDGVAPNAR